MRSRPDVELKPSGGGFRYSSLLGLIAWFRVACTRTNAIALQPTYYIAKISKEKSRLREESGMHRSRFESRKGVRREIERLTQA